MRDEQVQQLLCLLNHYACLCLLLLPAYLQIDRNFSQGDKTSTPPAALPVLYSGPHQCQAPLLAYAHPDDAAQQYATRIIKMLLSNTPHFLSPRSRHTRHQMAHSCHYNRSWKATQQHWLSSKAILVHSAPCTFEYTKQWPFICWHILLWLCCTGVSPSWKLLALPLASIRAFTDTGRQWGQLKIEESCHGIMCKSVKCDMLTWGGCVCYNMSMNRQNDPRELLVS